MDEIKKIDVREKVDNFLASVKDTTLKRSRTFLQLINFVMDGQQWTNDEILDRDGNPTLVFNSSEEFLERYLAKLFPKNPRTGVMEVGVKVFGDEANKEKYEQKILECYRKNDFPATLLEQGTNFLIGGAACLFYPKNIITGQADIFSVDPKNVYLGWKGYQLTQVAYIEDLSGVQNINITDPTTILKKRVFYMDLSSFIKIDENEQVEVIKNDLGFIPFSWIPCFPKPHYHEGRSKILSLYDLDREFNFRASDYSKRIEQNTEPERVIFSDNVGSKDKEKFKRGKNKTHFLGKDDDMRNLELSEGAQILDYLKLLDDKIRRKTGLIDSGGSIKSVASGVSLSLQYSDMSDLIGFMRIFWDKALRELNMAILKYSFGSLSSSVGTDPVYNPALLFDSKQRVDEYDVMLKNKLISRRDAIDELRGVENADQKIKEILAEDELFAPPAPADTTQYVKL